MEKAIKISVLKHNTLDLWMAVSEDMEGLVVHGKTPEEVEQRLPSVIRDLLEADGYTVVGLDLVEDRERTIPQFGPPAFLANASLCEAA